MGREAGACEGVRVNGTPDRLSLGMPGPWLLHSRGLGWAFAVGGGASFEHPSQRGRLRPLSFQGPLQWWARGWPCTDREPVGAHPYAPFPTSHFPTPHEGGKSSPWTARPAWGPLCPQTGSAQCPALPSDEVAQSLSPSLSFSKPRAFPSSPLGWAQIPGCRSQRGSPWHIGKNWASKKWVGGRIGDKAVQALGLAPCAVLAHCALEEEGACSPFHRLGHPLFPRTGSSTREARGAGGLRFSPAGSRGLHGPIRGLRGGDSA